MDAKKKAYLRQAALLLRFRTTSPTIKSKKYATFDIQLVDHSKLCSMFPSIVHQNNPLSVCDLTRHKIYINNYRWKYGSEKSKKIRKRFALLGAFKGPVTLP